MQLQYGLVRIDGAKDPRGTNLNWDNRQGLKKRRYQTWARICWRVLAYSSKKNLGVEPSKLSGCRKSFGKPKESRQTLSQSCSSGFPPDPQSLTEAKWVGKRRKLSECQRWNPTTAFLLYPCQPLVSRISSGFRNNQIENSKANAVVLSFWKIGKVRVFPE